MAEKCFLNSYRVLILDLEEEKMWSKTRKCRTVAAVLAVFFMLSAAGGIAACRNLAGAERTGETERTEKGRAGYVILPEYTGRPFSAVKPQTVDEAYMDGLMSEMLAMYNEIRGTSYEAWTDEQVSYTTQGRYKSEADWRAYLQEKYTRVEQEKARDATAQLILLEIASEAELTESGRQSMEEEHALESRKLWYVTEAIAAAEGLEPGENEIKAAREEHMSGVLEMGYREEDSYYREELEHWEKEEESFRQTLRTEAVKEFLYENNVIRQ